MALRRVAPDTEGQHAGGLRRVAPNTEAQHAGALRRVPPDTEGCSCSSFGGGTLIGTGTGGSGGSAAIEGAWGKKRPRGRIP